MLDLFYQRLKIHYMLGPTYICKKNKPWARSSCLLFKKMCFLKSYFYLQQNFPIATDKLVNAKSQNLY